MRNVLKSLCIAVGLIAASATSVHAEQFDTSFNGNGRYIDSTPNLEPIAILEQSDGSLLQVSSKMGGCGANNACPVFTYLTAAGNYVTSSSPVDPGLGSIVAAAIDSHGRIILVGESVIAQSVGGSNFRVVRYLPNVSLDTSFGVNGIAEVDFNGLNDVPRAVAIDGDDNVIVVGDARLGASDTDFGIAKLRGSDGTLDTSFNGTGKRTVYFDLGSTALYDGAQAIALSANGNRMTLVGAAYDSAISRYKVALARLNRDGTYDTTFCATSCNAQGNYTNINNGRRVYYFGQNATNTDNAYGIALLGNGGFFIVGETYESGRHAVITRFVANGDAVFESLNDGLGGNAGYSSVQVSDANGMRVLAAGESGPNRSNLLLQAFDSNLETLSGYGDCLNTTAFCFSGGTGTSDNGSDAARSLNLDRLGRPLFAGSFVANSGDPRKAIFARFTNNTGPLPDRIFRNSFQ